MWNQIIYNCSKKQDMATFVFWQPSWQPSWIFQNPQCSNQFITHIIEFFDPENIPLDTKMFFLTALECKIWLLLILVAILEAILDFLKPSTIKSIYNAHSWIPWPWKHTLRHQNHLPIYPRKQDMATFVFWRPSWWPSWIFQNAQGYTKGTQHFMIEDRPEKQNMQKKFILTSPRRWPPKWGYYTRLWAKVNILILFLY